MIIQGYRIAEDERVIRMAAALLEGDDREALYARLEESAARKHAYNRLE